MLARRRARTTRRDPRQGREHVTEPTTSQTGTHSDEAAPGEAPVAELVEAQETGADPVAADEVPGEGDTGAEERAAEGDADGDADGDSDGDSDGDADGDSDGGAAAD